MQTMQKVETEKCIVCGKDTGVPVSRDVAYRENYIHGAGQACTRCYERIYVVPVKK